MKSHSMELLRDEQGNTYGYVLDGKKYINNNERFYEQNVNFNTLNNNDGWKTGGFSNGILSKTLDDGTKFTYYANLHLILDFLLILCYTYKNTKPR